MMKVLFCGKQFNSGFEFTRDEILKRNLPIMVTSCYPDDLLKEVADAFVIIPFMCRIDRAVFEVAKELRMVMQYGVGLEGVDIESASEKRVWVCNIQSENCGNAQSCAEHALFLSFCLMRKLIEMKESISRGRIGNPTGETLFRSRVMLLGYGGIGRQLLRRLIPFDPVEIIVVVRRIDLNFLQSLQLVCSDSVTTIVQVSFDEFISSATGTYAVDTVFLCCTQNYQTLGLVNHIFLSKFAYPVNIINVARGGLLNVKDIGEDLVKGGKIKGLATDVFPVEPFPADDPLLHHPRVVATPHVAGVTEISYRNMANLVAENIQRVFQGQPPLGAVNSF